MRSIAWVGYAFPKDEVEFWGRVVKPRRDDLGWSAVAADYPFLDIVWTLFVIGVLVGAPLLVVALAVWLRRRGGSKRTVVIVGLAPVLALVVLSLASLALAGVLFLPAVAGLGVLAYGARIPGRAMRRECPHCREPVRADATVCPHCLRRLEPWTFQNERWWRRDVDGWLRLSDVKREWQRTDKAPTAEPAR